MSKSMWTGMFWGILVGAAAALLLAPQSGRSTRDMIAVKSKDAKNKAVKAASSASQKAQYMSGRIKQAI